MYLRLRDTDNHFEHSISFEEQWCLTKLQKNPNHKPAIWGTKSIEYCEQYEKNNNAIDMSIEMKGLSIESINISLEHPVLDIHHILNTAITISDEDLLKRSLGFGVLTLFMLIPKLISIKNANEVKAINLLYGVQEKDWEECLSSGNNYKGPINPYKMLSKMIGPSTQPIHIEP